MLHYIAYASSLCHHHLVPVYIVYALIMCVGMYVTYVCPNDCVGECMCVYKCVNDFDVPCIHMNSSH